MIKKELRKAIFKDNTKLLSIAKARLIYLKRVVPPKLLELGLNGDEEGLYNNKTFLYNNGWWKRVNNLNARSLGFQMPKSKEQIDKDKNAILDFILSNEKLVHPNVLQMVRKEDNKIIHMALNHIHYGSLKVLREVVELEELLPTTRGKIESVKDSKHIKVCESPIP